MPNCCAGQHHNEQGALWCHECGSLVEGARVGDYRLLSFIGKGSSADVYLAEQPALNRRRVVIKILPQARFSASVEAFRREAALLASLSHPYILPIFAYDVLYREPKRRDIAYDAQELCLPYLVLPFAERGSLAEIFAREGERPWSLGRVVTMAREVAEALDYAHGQGVLHRDVKPANILHMGSHALLSDFSVASLIDADASHLNAPWAGSPAYMAPEVWQLHPGRYSDQYALAVTCFYLLSGQLPWRKNEGAQSTNWTQLHNFVPPRALSEVRPDVPPAIDLVLQRALAKDPHRRYPTVQAFAADLQSASRDITQQVVSFPAQRPAVQRDIVATGSPVSPILKVQNMTPVDPATEPGSVRAARFAQTDSLRAVRAVKAVTSRNWWPEQALLLNLSLCVALAAEGAWQAGDILAGARVLLALWPAIFTGPLLALVFRRVSYQSLSWGLFWGMFFGLTDGLLSLLLCLAWIVLVFLPVSNACPAGCHPGGGFGWMLQAETALAPQATLPVVLGLWVSVIGGALIGIFHATEA